MFQCINRQGISVYISLKIKSDIKILTNQREKLLNLMLNEENEDFVKMYKDKLTDILSQISLQSDMLELHSSMDLDKEERAIREQFDLSCEDITYRDFQELSRAQLKVLFNYLIDHITIKELDPFDNKQVVLCITIHMKLDGYAPKHTLNYLKKLRTEDIEKSSHLSKKDNCLQNGGGEGETRTLAPVSRPMPLAGAPLHQLEYFSIVNE